MKNALITLLLAELKSTPDVVFLSVDQPTGFESQLKETLNGRFQMCPISEQFVAGYASGLAASGLCPIIFNYSAFTLRRSFEQLLLDCSYQNRKVVIVGMGAGYAQAHLGASHTITHDIALAKLIPNLDVMVPVDLIDLEMLVPMVLKSSRSSYIRLSKRETPQLWAAYDRNIPGVSVLNLSAGSDAGCPLIISVGEATRSLSSAFEELSLEKRLPKARHIGLSHLQLELVLPFLSTPPRPTVCYVFEEHGPGGVKSMIAELIATKTQGAAIQIRGFRAPNTPLNLYGTQEESLEHLCLDRVSMKNFLSELPTY